MFVIRRGLIFGAVILGSLGRAGTPYVYVGGTDGALALSYVGDSIWVYASGPEGPFAFHASTATLATWADSASVARFPNNNMARFTYRDTTIRDALAVELIRLTADSQPKYQLGVTAGRWSAAVTLSPDSARRFFALLHGKPQGSGATAPPPPSTETTYFDFQVKKQANPVRGGPIPVYPEPLVGAKVEGEVLAQFVVDTMGLADMSTFKVLKSTDPWLTSAVFGFLPHLRLTPAEIDGRKVRELIQQPYAFNLRQ